MLIKLETIRQGLLIAMELGDMKLEFELDSLETVNLIKAGDTLTHEFETTINDIRHILDTRLLIVIRHVLREANSCADTLFKISAPGMTRLNIWETHLLSYFFV